MIYIRQTHPYGYRSGEWAHLFSIQHNEDGQDVWIVEFPDGAMDAWPSWDGDAGYDVRVQIEHPEEVDHGNQVQPAWGPAGSAARKLRTQVAVGDHWLSQHAGDERP